MPENKNICIEDLSLDLDNYRTVHQQDEISAINTMILISPEKFYALIKSLADDGYHPTENLIILQQDGRLIVKEGNRRVAALKILQNQISEVELPVNVQSVVDKCTDAWREDNKSVPCSIYRTDEIETVDKIIARIHAKGEPAGRDKWTAVATARYNRDHKSRDEHGLELLELYLKKGRNFSEDQKDRWSGDYPLTVLNEALQKAAKHLHGGTIPEVVRLYPIRNKRVLDKLLFEIGVQELSFQDIRNKIAFLKRYNLWVESTPSPATPTSSIGEPDSAIGTPSGISSVSDTPLPKPSAPVALPNNDPRSVSRKLRSFKPRGAGREKIVAIHKEMLQLQITDHPHAFCFLLRCLFELSAKVYCKDHKSHGGPSFTNGKGVDKKLVDLLREITNYLTANKSDKAMVKLLHGAMSDLANENGLLSVSSMNQLIHNPDFSMSPGNICIMFHNIFPLLEEMNK